MKLKTKKNEFENMSIDNFLDNMDMDPESDQESPPPKLTKKKIEKGKKKKVEVDGKIKKKVVPKKPEPETVEEEEEDETEVQGDNSEVIKEHQNALTKLKASDPELYEFLKKNDKKLLKFGAMEGSDDEVEFSDDDEDDESDIEDLLASDDEKHHTLPEKLEVASDESDFEADKESDDEDGEEKEEEEEEEEEDGDIAQKITLKMLKKWNKDLLSEKVSAATLRTVTKAFNSALSSVSGDMESVAAYKVEGSAIFNGVIQLCVLHMQDAVKNFLCMKDSKHFKDLKSNKKFKKIRNCMKGYLIDLTNLVENVTSSNIMIVLLKHLHQFSSILVCFTSITKPILKRLIVIWSTSDEETIRVLSFLCILKITRTQQHTFLSDVLKTMYLAYVKNSKFVSPNTLPSINFMRRSLTEMFALDMNVSYQHVFLYVRQLAIHLRNAVILQKKDSFKYIYNWQFINSMKLWADVLGVTHDKQQLQPLVYPLVSIIIGVIKLIPSAQYFPLRFHCCRTLIQLSAATRIYIPVLPFLVEVLKSKSFNEDHKKLSMKPINLTCLLRFNQTNIQENAFKDAVMDNIYGLILEFMSNESCTVSFPDMAVPAIVALRAYSKETKNYKYSRQAKQLSDKITESSAFIEKERKKITFALKDFKQFEAWEATMRDKGTPLMTFYQNYAKENERVKRRQASNSDKISDFNLPTLKKKEKRVREENEGPVELFPSDEDDSEVDLGEEMSEDDLPVEQEAPKAKRSKKEKKKSKKNMKNAKNLAGVEVDEEFPTEYAGGEQVDIVQDLKLDDWN